MTDKGLQDGNETSYDVWFGDRDTGKKTGGKAGGGKAEYVNIL